ncbi:MAG: MBL fold metallo-hydrolase, partial [Calditrichaeota bacterium]|nr:MBL fold metallo-hydrolase [Calditrichota bacterium]
CNIIEYAKKVCGDNRIRDIIGGFHLINTTEMQLKETLKSLRLKNPVVIHPCHCTGQNSINVISEEVNTEEIGVGFTVEYI